MSRHLPLVAGICTLLIGAMPTFAEYPRRPITLIVPAAAGGFNDVIARVVAEHMARTLGQPIIIENDPGAGGTNPGPNCRAGGRCRAMCQARQAEGGHTDNDMTVCNRMGHFQSETSPYPNYMAGTFEGSASVMSPNGTTLKSSDG